MPEKDLKFVENRRDDTVAFNLSFILLLMEVDPISKEQSCKRYILGVCSSCHIKIVFALLAKIIALHMGATIVFVGVLGIEDFILRSEVCFAMFLTLNKKF